MTTSAVRRRAAPGSQVFAALVLASGVAVILVMTWLVNHQDSEVFTMHFNYSFKDLFGRVANLNDLRRTGNIYVPFGYQAFTYPPGAIFFFWPILWVPIQHLSLVWNFVTLAALAASIYVSLIYLTKVPRLLLAGLACWAAVISAAIFPELIEHLMWGQTATILMLFVLLDMLIIRGPAKGVLIGLAAAIKIYPGLFIIVWLLRRQWRPALTALATTAGVTGLAFAIWPTSGRYFVHHIIFGGQEFQKLAGTANSLKSGSFVAFFQRWPFHYGTISTHEGLLLEAAVMVLALLAAQRLWRAGLDFCAVIVVLIAGAIASPVAWDHYFSFAPLLILVALEARANTALGRTAIVATVVSLVPWVIFRTPSITTSWTTTYAFVARNALLLSTFAVIVVALWRRDRHRRVGVANHGGLADAASVSSH
ncbi:MAG TPA: glycosyltransferase family 87 protein [Acidimicrobiales bacterium]|nr:glycosyltransferase family 87 protein [Acidimicrobiales bacterium]